LKLVQFFRQVLSIADHPQLSVYLRNRTLTVICGLIKINPWPSSFPIESDSPDRLLYSREYVREEDSITPGEARRRTIAFRKLRFEILQQKIEKLTYPYPSADNFLLVFHFTS